MLLFIARLVRLADTMCVIVLLGRRVEDRLLASCRRAEHVMLVVLCGLLGQVEAHRPMPGLDAFAPCGETVDRQAEVLRLAAAYRQIATALALILSMSPRAFRRAPPRPAAGLPLAGTNAARRRVPGHFRQPCARPRIPP